MDPAPCLANGGSKHVHERGDVVLGDALALVDRLHREASSADSRELARRGALLTEQAGELLDLSARATQHLFETAQSAAAKSFKSTQ